MFPGVIGGAAAFVSLGRFFFPFDREHGVELPEVLVGLPLGDGRPICNKPPSRGSPVRAVHFRPVGRTAWSSAGGRLLGLHSTTWLPFCIGRDRTCPRALHGLIIPQWPKTRNQRLRRAYKDGSGYLVEAEWPDGVIQLVDDFGSESEALEWIAEKSDDWVRKHPKPA